MKVSTVLILVCFIALSSSGCSTSREYGTSSLTGLQSRTIHSRYIGKDFNAGYKAVWWATISALQLNGFVLRNADCDSGYIYGVWQNHFEDESLPVLFTGLSFGYQRAIEVSVTLERIRNTETLVRISCRGDGKGHNMDNAEFSSRFFATVNKELFLKLSAN